MADQKLLPPEYRVAWGSQYRLYVGQLVQPYYWGNEDPDSEFERCFLWRIEEPAPDRYVAVAYGIDCTVELTPENALFLCPIEEQVSERLKLEDYPRQWRQFRDRGIGVYLFEGERGRVCLRVCKRRVNYEGFLMPIWITDVQRNPSLMEQWLEQALWCIAHPRKASALYWATRQGERPFGQWPNLVPPAELDQAGSQWLVEYRKFKAWAKANPPTQEEIDAHYRKVYGRLREMTQEYTLAHEIRAGQHDEALLPEVRQLIGEAGIRPPE